MKLKFCVTGLDDAGDVLRVTAQEQGFPKGAVRSMLAVVITVPLNDRTRTAYYIGRVLKVDVRPA